MCNKIKSLEDLEKILEKNKTNEKKIIHCHGVFDLLHPGHIRHFKEAKSKGDVLVVSITSDRYVNKGPNRPIFNQQLRAESIAALSFVDFVSINDAPDVISAIKFIKPDYYIKGKEYENASKDITGKIEKEADEVKKYGGKVHFTDGIVFSSSSLINNYFECFTDEQTECIKKIKQNYSFDEIIKKIEDLKNLKVLVVGDAIIDEYQYVNILGQTGKGYNLVGEIQDNEKFLGGSLIIANNIAEFSDNVVLLTGIGKECKNADFIEQNLRKNINFKKINFENFPTLIKKRYLLRDGNHLEKFFETYSSNIDLLNDENTLEIQNFLSENINNYDLVLICDFGNGFINSKIKDSLVKTNSFLALNTQINSGNRGFNVITHYKKADYISINEAELRLAAHDRKTSISDIAVNMLKIMHSTNISITRGTKGVISFNKNDIQEIIPSFNSNSIDRVGAGDSYFALSSLMLSNRNDMLLSSFLGSLAAALKVQYVGNKFSINKIDLCKFVNRLMK